MTDLLPSILDIGKDWLSPAIVLGAVIFQRYGLSKRLTRLELLDMLSHRPERRDMVLGIYDAYKKQGGNSYVDTLIDEWRQTHVRKENEAMSERDK